MISKMASVTPMFVVFSCIICATVSAIPLHASCKIDWSFGIECAEVKTKLLDIINQWKGPDNCNGGGEKCLYKVTSVTDNELKATHETPKKHYVDDLTFTFMKGSASGCSVKGYSTSETWYAVLDYGTNYCNLHNLITGAGLDKVPQYKESTSNSVCTQFSTANCDKY